MFKFRRRSLCSSKEVFTPREGDKPPPRSRSEEKQVEQDPTSSTTKDSSTPMKDRKRKDPPPLPKLSQEDFWKTERKWEEELEEMGVHPRHHNIAKPTSSLLTLRQIERVIDYNTPTQPRRKSGNPESIPTVQITPEDTPTQETKNKMSFLEEIREPSSTPLLSPHPPSLLSLSTSPLDLPPSPPNQQLFLQPPVRQSKDDKLAALTSQLSILKKTLKQLEEEHLVIFGHKPSHAEKMKIKRMKKLVGGIGRVKAEMRALSGVSKEPNLAALSATVTTILTTLPPSPLPTSKSHLQRQLLYLEKKHGRPTSKEEKELVRELYDKYREIKTGLGVIGEEEQLQISEQVGVAEKEEQPIVEEEENFYSGMSLSTLTTTHACLLSEKRSIRSTLRSFERDFQSSTGRLPLKEEKGGLDGQYLKYKKIRAKLRLVEVLIKKEKGDM